MGIWRGDKAGRQRWGTATKERKRCFVVTCSRVCVYVSIRVEAMDRNIVFAKRKAMVDEHIFHGYSVQILNKKGCCPVH